MTIKREKKQSDDSMLSGTTVNVNDEKERQIEQSLRPVLLSEYVGQTEIKNNLGYLMESARIRQEPLDHILLHGPPGLGKTTLANIVAKEIKANLKVTSGPALEKQGDIASIITNLKENDVLFIDEIHRLRPPVEEMLYSAMEDFAIDIMIGKGPAAKSMRLKLPRFTLIGATTKVSMISSPMRDRFGVVYKLQFYSIDEIKEVVLRSANKLRIKVDAPAADLIAKSSRQTPRIANRLLRRVRDYSVVHKQKTVDLHSVAACLALMGIDKLGLEETDRHLLMTIINNFHGGPVGLSSLSAATSDDESTIEDVYEPYLLQLGMLERTNRGRIATTRAYHHLNLKI